MSRTSLAVVLVAVVACDSPDPTPSDPLPTSYTQVESDTGSLADSSDTGTSAADTSSTGSTGDTGGTPVDPCSDAYAGNDAEELAVPTPWSEALAVAPGWLDYWTVEVPSGEIWVLSMAVLPSGDPGDLEVSWLQTNGEMSRPTPYDLALHNSSVDPIVYTVAVATEAAPDACVAYQLDVEVLTTPICEDGVGDTWLEAAPLVQNGNRLVGTDTLHSGDEDWFTATAESEFEGDFILDDVGAESGVVIELYDDPTAPPLAATDGRYSYEYFELDLYSGPFPPGVYYVRVSSLGTGPVCLRRLQVREEKSPIREPSNQFPDSKSSPLVTKTRHVR